MAKLISVLALGSRGDVQPYVALGSALRDAGYRVRLATFVSFRELAAGAGLEFHPVPGDAQALVGIAAGEGMNSRNPLRLMQSIRQSYGALVDGYIESFSGSALLDSDAILNQLPGGLFGRDLAGKLAIPHLTVSVIPLLRTRAFPMPLLLARPLPGVPNRLTYTAAEQLFWLFFRRASTRFRASLGLPPAPLWYEAPDNPVLFGFSPLVIPPPPDWGPQVHVTGWWALDEPGWAPPADLAAFLEAGPPPVFIGFGSMIAPDPAALTRQVIEAVQASGQRVVLSRGWAGMGGTELPDTVFQAGYAPYAWLFPRMAAVIHHGGSGTTGVALRSGVPSLV
ncbi:MAG: glycosyltransferase, partial [Caldilineaceae bacterium]